MWCEVFRLVLDQGSLYKNKRITLGIKMGGCDTFKCIRMAASSTNTLCVFGLLDIISISLMVAYQSITGDRGPKIINILVDTAVQQAKPKQDTIDIIYPQNNVSDEPLATRWKNDFRKLLNCMHKVMAECSRDQQLFLNVQMGIMSNCWFFHKMANDPHREVYQ